MKNMDEYWDLSALVPPKRRTSFSAPTEIAPREISFREDTSSSEDRSMNRLYSQSERHLFFEDAVLWNPLIHGVKVWATPNTYKLHHLFREDAVRYLKEEGVPCDYVPCYSYIPQYAQLNASQRAYYFYFRDQANKGSYIQVNQSYFLLYVYEILNLPDHISPKCGVERLAKVWAAYRKVLPGIDKYMVTWVADYALIHGVLCPLDALQPFLHEVLSLSSLKEFYLAATDTLSSCQMDAFLSLSSSYSYQSGRYAQSEHKELFLEHISAACRLALSEVLREEEKRVSFQTVKKEYPAYVGALCSEANRYMIEVSYCSVSGTESLRTLVTSLVKYAENKVRAALLIKSRLSVPCLPPKYKALLDAYFEEHLPCVRKNAKGSEVRPAYEEMYDAPTVGISDDIAQNIEEESWKNTRLLVSEEEAEELFSVEKNPPTALMESNKDALSCEDAAALALLFKKNEQSARAYTASVGLMLENAVERINEYFTDTIGDIVISMDDGGMTVIEDYETEVEAFIAPYENIWKTWM